MRLFYHEKVLCCLYKMFLKKLRNSYTSQPCYILSSKQTSIDQGECAWYLSNFIIFLRRNSFIFGLAGLNGRFTERCCVRLRQLCLLRDNQKGGKTFPLPYFLCCVLPLDRLMMLWLLFCRCGITIAKEVRGML